MREPLRSLSSGHATNIDHIRPRTHRLRAGGAQSPESWRAGRRFRAGRVPALAVSVVGLVALATPVASSGATAASLAGGQLTLTGHGFGPGYGLGQWGAFGLAAEDHWTYTAILAHAYSDKAHPVTDAILSPKSDAQVLSVVIEENDNSAVTVTSPSPFTYLNGSGKRIWTVSGGTAARAVEIASKGALSGLWEIETAPSCTAKTWKRVVASVADPVAVPASSNAAAPLKDLLTLCRADGQDITYRGRLEAYDYYGANTGNVHLERTLNLVPLEQYVADVTPGESPAGWGTYGVAKNEPQDEPWGFQELEAQAVASRSYVLSAIASGGWYGYADICDDVCEYYSEGVRFETPLSTLAARDTQGRYLVQDKQPAPTEYSSSDGGYSETLSYWNGQSIFDAVPDKGDAVCLGGTNSLGCNPWHTWKVSISVAQIERDFPAIGTLTSVKVVATDSSGRVSELELSGSKTDAKTGKPESTSEEVSGATFQEDFGLLSTLFVVTDGPGATQAPDLAAPTAPRLGVGAPGLRPAVGPFAATVAEGTQH